MAPPKLETIFDAVETNLLTVTTANGYNNDIVVVERQHQIRRIEQTPCFFINVGRFPIEHRPARQRRITVIYTVLGGVCVDVDDDDTLFTTLASLAQDFDAVFYSDQYLIAASGTGTRLLVDHKIEEYDTDEGFMAPKAIFIARCRLIYDAPEGSL